MTVCACVAKPAAEPVLGGPSLPVLATWPDWPDAGVGLTPDPVVLPAELVGRWVAVDAGHGAPGNPGAPSANCTPEADLVLPLAERIADDLEAAGLRVLRLRPAGQGPSYRTRLARLNASKAELMVSLHGDIRGRGRPWTAPNGCEGVVSYGQHGFSVLWSDEAPVMTRGRRRLAHHLAQRLGAAGFSPYDGVEYESLYLQTAPGAFVDRHIHRQRIAFLRRPAMPSAIVEVGHLRDPRVESRLGEVRVQVALSAAVVGAVVDTLRGLPDPSPGE